MNTTKTPTICLDFACNDHRNGMFQGWFESAVIEGAHIELEGPRIRITEVSNRVLRVGRITLPIIGSRDWVGNWCWNGYTLKPTYAVTVLNYLRKRGYRCDAGPCEIYDRWNAEGEDLNQMELLFLLGS